MQRRKSHFGFQNLFAKLLNETKKNHKSEKKKNDSSKVERAFIYKTAKSLRDNVEFFQNSFQICFWIKSLQKTEKFLSFVFFLQTWSFEFFQKCFSGRQKNFENLFQNCFEIVFEKSQNQDGSSGARQRFYL